VQFVDGGFFELEGVLRTALIVHVASLWLLTSRMSAPVCPGLWFMYRACRPAPSNRRGAWQTRNKKGAPIGTPLRQHSI